MWAADRVVASTPGSAITIPETANEFSIKAGGIFLYKTPNQAYQLLEDKVLLKLNWAKNQKTKSSLKKTVAFVDECSSNSNTDNIMARMDAVTLKIDAQYKELQTHAKKTKPNLDEDDILCLERKIHANFFIDVIDEILEEDFDAILDEGSKIIHSIEGTLLEEEIFTEFNEFMAMTVDENSYSKSDTEDPQFEKITINTDYKIKTSLKEPPTDLELKPLPDNLEYVFLEEPSFLPVIISSQKSGITVVTNENDELVPTRTIMGWRVCIDYSRLNEATTKDHFPLSFMDQMLERLAGNKYFCFLDGFSGYFQIPIDPNDQEKTTFTCPFKTYAYRRMTFRLCNAPATFQRCMLAIFHDMIEDSVEVFMGDFSVFGNSFDTCLNNLDKMLQCCKDAHLLLN
nr:reverse transcriptase domain-containing protein [Tanacetum cinerariifolium]